MGSPFPGMDPYLEQPARWVSFHTRYIVAMADALQLTVGDRYFVEIEERIFEAPPEELALVGLSDVSISLVPSAAELQIPGSVSHGRVAQVTVPRPIEVRERYLQVVESSTRDVVTVIELLSPTNKLKGVGRDTYIRKRDRILSSLTSLVEIDLLRSGLRMPVVNAPEDYDYSVLVDRSGDQHAALHYWTVREPMPDIGVPLRSGDSDAVLSLQTVFNGVYDRSAMSARIDYSTNPVPPLAFDTAEWARAQIQVWDSTKA